jgi:hypothetical protein
MSRPGELTGSDRPDPCGCDPEKLFELADTSSGSGELNPDQERKIRGHLASCLRCRELYERELDLNACLSSLDFSVDPPRSVYQSVAMALPTRSLKVRLLLGLLASALLIVALVSLEFNGTKPVVLTMNTLGMCWDFAVGSARVAHAIFAVAGPAIIFVLALGALVDLLIALLVLFVSRRRRTREV